MRRSCDSEARGDFAWNMKIPCRVMRGGTSKGIFFNASDLPAGQPERDRVIQAVFGSPDPRQIDGLGGADPLTSKVAIIAASDQDDADVIYTFGQVGIEKAEIVYANNCGNLSAAVGPYAVDSGMVKAEEPFTTVRIFNTNTRKRILAHVPVLRGRAATEGDCRIDGVPGSGAPIRLTFCEPVGAVTGKLLPTGNPVDHVILGNGTRLEVSVVDCAALYTFLPATGLGLGGGESAAELDARQDVADRVDDVRRELSGRLTEMGAVSAAKGKVLRTSLKVAIVGAAGSEGRGGDHVVSRILNPGRTHKTFAVTGAIALAAASTVAGTVVARLVAAPPGPPRRVSIGHPKGSIEAEIAYQPGEPIPNITSATITRTARLIMDGFVHVPDTLTALWA
jgi:2-methylaconitate cis-trans-isomerase PrpF